MKAMVMAGLGLVLAGCAVAPVGDETEGASRTPAAATAEVQRIARSPWAAQSLPPAPASTGWEHQTFHGKAPNQFRYVRQDGRDAVATVSSASASLLRHAVRIAPQDLGRVRFSWKVPELMAAADMASREADDAPVRIVLAFDGDRSRFSPRDALLAELVRTLTGEPMPYATLMYVWCNQRAAGSVIRSPRTDRIRKLVVQSGPRELNRWLDYERDIRADFQAAFGEPPGPLIGIAIMTDSDNTRSRTQAWYGPVRLLPVAARAAAAN